MGPRPTLEDRERLEKLSVKDLRRQAALSNVPLSQISAALEKPELIALILRAGPVKDTYGVGVGVKVHSASTIAVALRQPKQKKEKKKKEEKKRRESSSSSSSRSSRGKKKKRSRSRSKAAERARQKAVAAAASKRRAGKAGRSRSPSLQMLGRTTHAGKPLPALPPPIIAAKARRPAGTAQKALPPVPINDVEDLEEVVTIASEPSAKPSKSRAPRSEKPKDIAQVGVLAAAKLGFQVLPKAPSTGPMDGPAPGLRPSINNNATATLSPWGEHIPGMGGKRRVCTMYLQNARCDLGSNCPDVHITDPEEEMLVRARFKEQICNYGANCTRTGCLFRHPGERVEEASLTAQGGAEELLRRLAW